MLKKVVFVFLGLLCSAYVHAQVKEDILIGVNIDLIKTDNNTFLGKSQIGVEGNYFLANRFSVTGGLDLWTDKGLSLVSGIRWYPADESFVRLRGMVGAFNDISVGGGWTQPITRNWQFEAIGDFYFSIDFAIRAGVVYTLGR